jgi:hypothetical protein
MNGGSYLSDAFEFVHRSFLTVDAQLGLLIIALIAAFMMKSWKQIWPMALLAVVVDIIVMALWPLVNHGGFHLPDFFLLSFWLNVLALYIGFVIVIAVFYFLRTMLIKTAKAS